MCVSHSVCVEIHLINLQFNLSSICPDLIVAQRLGQNEFVLIFRSPKETVCADLCMCVFLRAHLLLHVCE